MKRKLGKPSKKVIIIASIVLLVCAVGGGVWYYLGHNSSDPVFVYPFQYIGMTEYWGDSQESYGPVTTDKIQTIFLSDTQKVTEVCVKEGDEVKKGDLLMTFDTTLSDLALERKRLAVEKLRLDLDEAKKELRRIKGLKPMEVPEYNPPSYDPPAPTEPNLGSERLDAYKNYPRNGHDGSSISNAMVCWLRSDKDIDNELFEIIRQEIQDYRNSAVIPSSASDATGDDEIPAEPETPVDPEHPVNPDPPVDPEPPVNPDPPVDPEQPVDPDPPVDPETPVDPEPPVDPEEPPQETVTVKDYYVVFKVTQGNMSMGMPTTWQGLHVTKSSGGGFKFSFFDASAVGDYTRIDSGISQMPDIPDMPNIDYGSGLTAEQISQMRLEQERKLKDLDFQIKMANAEYKIMQTEVSDGKIYSDIDGKVISLLSEEEAKKQQQPVMKVSGGGGFYVEGAVNELDRENLKIGQEVTINDWRNGMTYTGSVKSIGDFPNMHDSYMGAGNPTASYYPFQVFVDSSADLQAGSYVSVTYSAGESKNGVYLSNPFVRTEQGRSYVLVQGADGKLEKRFVTTGKSLWGSYTEILTGLTPEDMIAFPYGKNVKPGIPVQEGDLSDLYG